MYVPRTLDENLVAIVSLLQIPKEGGEIWGDWSTMQTLLDLSTEALVEFCIVMSWASQESFPFDLFIWLLGFLGYVGERT